MRHVSGGNGQGGQDSTSVHFGLADTTEIDQVVVDFPGAGRVTFPGPFPVDRRLWVAEDGRTATGWDPPSWVRAE